MTGEKNRYTTTEKLWSLDDKTLKTPAHDEMVLWLLNRDNIDKILPFDICYNIVLKDFEGGDGFFKWQVASQIFNNNYNILECFGEKTTPKNIPNFREIDGNQIWSEMVEDYHQCDLAYNYDYDIQILSEVPITAQNGFLVGYTDICVKLIIPKLYNGEYFKYECLFPLIYYIEVKPVIKSFGETLRQLNTYKHYLHTDKMYLFTTDLRFKEAFESQGIKVLTYPDQ